MHASRLVIALAFLAAAPALAHAQTALRADSTVNVRTGPSTGYTIIGQVPAGAVYVGFAQSGDWWKIWYNGGEGWTYGPLYTSISGTTGVKVTVDTLNVRTGPDTSYSIQGHVYMGQIYFWTSTAGDWYKINWGGGTGYVYGGYVTRVSLSGGSPSPGTLTNLPMDYYRQVTNYFCGPTTAQMVIKYVSGTTVSQYTIAAYCGTSPSYGTSESAVDSAIRYYSGDGYDQVYWFDRTRAVSNIQQNKPVPINFQCHYLAYWGYSYAMHHSPIKGYTSGGFYIHDTWTGPNEWASSTEVWNAVNYHYGLWGVRY